MTPFSFLLIFISESCMIVGQLYFKHATSYEGGSKAYFRSLGLGVAAMSIYFFVWLALLRKFELSYLFPFDGMNRVLLVAAAAVFLKERASPRIWVGVILISAGVMLVSGS